MNSAAHIPKRVVLGPDVIAKGFVNTTCLRILESWRDGKVRPVVTRELLVLYLKILRSMKLPDSQLRTWTIWFTAKDKSIFISEPASHEMKWNEVLIDAAQRGDAEVVVSDKELDVCADSALGVLCVTPEQFEKVMLG